GARLVAKQHHFARFELYPCQIAGNSCIFAAFLFSQTRVNEITAFLQHWWGRRTEGGENAALVKWMDRGEGGNAALVSR
ncbi:hypothetical protein P4K96_14930, partial [Bacillus cereus]|nr:hypothetical protein [Bacillus cereus]